MKKAPPNPRNYNSPESRSERSLVCLIQSLVGRKATIELQTDVMVKGMLESVDEYMNLALTSATATSLDGRQSSYEWIYIKGRNVRMFHLPRSLDPGGAIDAHREQIIETRMAQLKERRRNPLSRLDKGACSSMSDGPGGRGDEEAWLEAIEEEEEGLDGEEKEEREGGQDAGQVES